jgi:hypothetical protein
MFPAARAHRDGLRTFINPRYALGAAHGCRGSAGTAKRFIGFMDRLRLDADGDSAGAKHPRRAPAFTNEACSAWNSVHWRTYGRVSNPVRPSRPAAACLKFAVLMPKVGHALRHRAVALSPNILRERPAPSRFRSRRFGTHPCTATFSWRNRSGTDTWPYETVARCEQSFCV